MPSCRSAARKPASSPSTGGAKSADAGAARLIMVQTLTIATSNFITSPDLFIRRRDFGGVGFGQVRRMNAGSLARLWAGCQDLLDRRYGVREIGNHHEWACAAAQ